eukprot:547997_1
MAQCRRLARRIAFQSVAISGCEHRTTSITFVNSVLGNRAATALPNSLRSIAEYIASLAERSNDAMHHSVLSRSHETTVMMAPRGRRYMRPINEWVEIVEYKT